MRRNLFTSLKSRNCPRPMDRYDRLPPELRRWLAGAALPWSPASALKLWTRICADCGRDPDAIRHRLDRAEARMLAKDAAKIWGDSYPVELQDGDHVKAEKVSVPVKTAHGRDGLPPNALAPATGARVQV